MLPRKRSKYFSDEAETTTAAFHDLVQDDDDDNNDVSMLNEEQRLAYDMALAGETFMIDGPAGVGKSMVIGKINRALSQRHGDRLVAVTALTGTAANLLEDGVTLHSWCGMQLMAGRTETLVRDLMDKHRRMLKRVSAKQKRYDELTESQVRALTNIDAYTRLRETRVLIIDEISMLSCKLFRKLDNVLRRVREQLHTPFGGLQVILSGDFFQLAPVTGGQRRKQAQKRSWAETHQARGGGGGISATATDDPDASTDYSALSADEADRHRELARHREHLQRTGELTDLHYRLATEWLGSRDLKENNKRAKFKRKRQRVSVGNSTKKYAFESERWRLAIGSRVVRLHRTYRQEDPRFIELLTRAREGRINADDVRLLRARVGVNPSSSSAISPSSSSKTITASTEEEEAEVYISPLSVYHGGRLLHGADRPPAIDTLLSSSSNGRRRRHIPELHSKRREVDEINARELAKLRAAGERKHLFTAQVGISDRPEYVTTQGAEQLLMGDDTVQSLELRVGALVRLTVNLRQRESLVNGSTGVVVGFIRVLPGKGHAINDAWAPYNAPYPTKPPSTKAFADALQAAREIWFTEPGHDCVPLVYFEKHSQHVDTTKFGGGESSPSSSSKRAFLLPVFPFVRPKRVPFAQVDGWVAQIPLKLSWAITIHGSQGVSLSEARIDLRRSRWDPVANTGTPGIFAPGQAYVALSRIRDPEGLCLDGFDPEAIYASEEVKRFYMEADALADKKRKLSTTDDDDDDGGDNNDDDDDDNNKLAPVRFLDYVEQHGDTIDTQPSQFLEMFMRHFRGEPRTENSPANSRRHSDEECNAATTTTATTTMTTTTKKTMTKMK